MPSTINANNSTGLVYSSDTSGQLLLQTNGTTALTVDSSQNVGIAKASITGGAINGVTGSNPSMSVGYAGGALGTSFFTSGTTENQIGVQLTGYASAYLYSNSNSWGLYSSVSGTLLQYTRSDGSIRFNGNARTLSSGGDFGGSPLTFSYDGKTTIPAYIWGTKGDDLAKNELYVSSNFFTKGLGFGGTSWTDVTGIRDLNTLYQNTNAYPIQISVTCIPPNPPHIDQYGSVQIVINGLLIGSSTSTGRGSPVPCNMTVIVPSGAYYYATGTILQQWTELY
jgi:hypothetical protein